MKRSMKRIKRKMEEVYAEEATQGSKNHGIKEKESPREEYKGRK